MAKKVEISVEEKLRALFDLQLIDSRIDQIRSIRGELPLEVEDLENEIEGLNNRLESFENEIKESQDGIKFEENSISTSKENHKKYEGDLKKVRNNREYNAIVKEQEFEKKIEDTLIAAYKRIRSNVRNGLAIVPIERNASGGSYFTIPPQVQMEIASRQKIITDEYSGRILVDPQLAEEEMDKMKSIFS